MGRHKTDLLDSPAGEIYAELCKFAKEQQAIPNMHAFWAWVLPRLGYEMKFGKYRYYWNELRIAGLIRMEPITNAVSIVDLAIVERDDPPLARKARNLGAWQELPQILHR